MLGEIAFGLGRGSYVSGEELGEWEDFLRPAFVDVGAADLDGDEAAAGEGAGEEVGGFGPGVGG